MREATDERTTVSTRADGRVTVVTIERPERRNAVDLPTARALYDAVKRFDADPAVDVAVLTGAGGAFCAGFDLKAVAETLVTADESWTSQRGKLKQPAVWLMAMYRLTGVSPDNTIGQLLGAQASLGQALWRPPAPNGYPDSEAAWIDGVPRRLDIANTFAGRVASKADPLALLDASLGPLASSETRNTIARAESRAQALALLFMAPEFLRS